MKKKIAILGSTGSIGESLINIIKQNRKGYKIVLLTANKDYKKLLQQAKKFKVKNFVSYSKGWNFTSHENFWNNYNIDKIRDRSKGISL